ncbi:MAG TPA: thioesterase family protein [Gaiellaceae bacterium]|nr:thioesterase family protein [Gaiellaceae bacterium]HSJ92566.1 thioesterase family protein [Gaiellaceae bacterium]
MDGFRIVHAQPVEFRDLDGLGHVNNAVYLNYLENGKIAYFRDVVGAADLQHLGIVADVKIAYRSPAFLGEELAVGVRVGRLGTKSMEFEFEVRGRDGRLVAEGTSVHVAFDYDRLEPIPVPDEWRRRIESHESESLAAT